MPVTDARLPMSSETATRVLIKASVLNATSTWPGGAERDRLHSGGPSTRTGCLVGRRLLPRHVCVCVCIRTSSISRFAAWNEPWAGNPAPENAWTSDNETVGPPLPSQIWAPLLLLVVRADAGVRLQTWCRMDIAFYGVFPNACARPC